MTFREAVEGVTPRWVLIGDDVRSRGVVDNSRGVDETSRGPETVGVTGSKEYQTPKSSTSDLLPRSVMSFSSETLCSLPWATDFTSSGKSKCECGRCSLSDLLCSDRSLSDGTE